MFLNVPSFQAMPALTCCAPGVLHCANPPQCWGNMARAGLTPAGYGGIAVGLSLRLQYLSPGRGRVGLG